MSKKDPQGSSVSPDDYRNQVREVLIPPEKLAVYAKLMQKTERTEDDWIIIKEMLTVNQLVTFLKAGARDDGDLYADKDYIYAFTTIEKAEKFCDALGKKNERYETIAMRTIYFDELVGVARKKERELLIDYTKSGLYLIYHWRREALGTTRKAEEKEMKNRELIFEMMRRLSGAQ
ncbi:MAG: hypothetical protein IJ088_01780 [Clostridia bacterium]|nr:hypothetical protein [Clostridia bacterium]